MVMTAMGTLNSTYNELDFNEKIGYNKGKSPHQIYTIHL